MSDEIEVFPSVDAVTLEVDGQSIFIRQFDTYEQATDAVCIPRIFLPHLAAALFQKLSDEELKVLNRTICAEQREGRGRG